jgi:DMSO/TMAO reductase YedYZ molybdopterin-dependent catalytic subunit
MSERAYDEHRLRDFLAGRTRGFSRRELLALTAAAAFLPASPASAASPIVKPLPADLFRSLGTNAETRFSALKDQGYYVPVDRFFVRNHTVTPTISPDSWQLEVSGSGTKSAFFGLSDIKRLPSVTAPIAIECAGNGRSYYTSQQGQTVSGTAWTLGAIGVGRWRGVKLSTLLRKAGITRNAVDVQPIGLDPDFVSGGVDLGPVRRPFPVRKAFDDVILAYELNGEPLPPDHGFPVRVVVPHWIGISSIKWVGRIEVSAEPLFSPWNTQFRLPNHPDQSKVVFAQPEAGHIVSDPTGQASDPTGSVPPWGHRGHYCPSHGLVGTSRKLGATQLASRRQPRRRPPVVHVLRPDRGPRQTRRRR